MTQPDPSAQSGAGTQGQSAPDGTGPTTGTGAQSGAVAGGTATPEGAQSGAPATFTAAEMEAIRTRLQAADRRASAVETELKAIRDKDLPELEKLKRDAAELVEVRAQLESDLRAARMESAFLRDNTYAWHNPGTALKMADLSKVDIGENGEVVGLKAALDALAKSDPYLIKPEATTDDSDDKTPPPGAPPVNGGQPGGQASSTAAVAKRFPAIRNRLG